VNKAAFSQRSLQAATTCVSAVRLPEPNEPYWRQAYDYAESNIWLEDKA